MSEATVAADIHQTLDVEGNLGSEVTFNLVLLFDDLPQKSDVICAESIDSDLRVNICLGADFLSGSPANSVDVSQGNLDCLVRQVNTFSQTMRTTPARLMTLHLSQIGLTLALTFIVKTPKFS